MMHERNMQKRPAGQTQQKRHRREMNTCGCESGCEEKMAASNTQNTTASTKWCAKHNMTMCAMPHSQQ